jgi:hypothetical protein
MDDPIFIDGNLLFNVSWISFTCGIIINLPDANALLMVHNVVCGITAWKLH